MQIAALTGLSNPPVRRTIDLYEAGGLITICPVPCGREPDNGRSLSAEQEEVIKRIICDKRPEHSKMEFALPNRAAVMQLIERECAVKLHVRTCALSQQVSRSQGFYTTKADPSCLQATTASAARRAQ